MKSYCSSKDCEFYKKEFIVNKKTLICRCKRCYCDNCWYDANDCDYDWREDDETEFGIWGELHIFGCDYCGGVDFEEPLEPEKRKEFKEYLERNEKNYKKLIRALKNKK